MREIKFRGKGISTKEWLFGMLITTGKRYSIMPFNWSLNLGDAQVIPETIGQFTGFKDKNGKDIYEGDICKGRMWPTLEFKNTVVKYDDTDFGRWGFYDENDFCRDAFEDRQRYEVVGNIHDNLELLKTK